MKNILVIDSKLVMYFQYHRHKHPFNCFQDVAKVATENLPRIDKIVWAYDEGKSKRCEFYPLYKAHRADEKKKASAKEQKRRDDFEKLYRKSKQFLRYFGDVVAIPGYEADDIANIVAERYAGSPDVNVYLFSSDEDWSRFLYADNIKLLHYGRAHLIGAEEVEKEFNVPYEHKLFVDALAGVGKENVDGLVKLGKGRIMKALEDNKYDEDATVTTLQEWCDIHKYGARLPEWANSVQDVLDRNIKILSPYSYSDLTDDEKIEFQTQWDSKVPISATEVLISSNGEYGTAVVVTPIMQKFYKISA